MKYIIGNTPQWKLLRLAAELRTSKQLNKNVKIKLINPEGLIEEHILRYDILVDEYTANAPNRFTIISDGFYYIDLTRYTEEGFQSLINEIKDKLQNAKYIIFDLRGFTTVKDRFLGMFTQTNLQSYENKIPVYTHPDKSPNPFLKINHSITPLSPQINAKSIFLIDEKTSGQAEIIAALVKRYNFGTLLGNNTSGNFDEVLGINLPGNYKASMVVMINEIPGSLEKFNKGITPDVKVLPDFDIIYQGKDYILNEVQKLFK